MRVRQLFTNWDRRYKVEQLLQRKSLHLHDTSMNGDPSLLMGPLPFRTGVV